MGLTASGIGLYEDLTWTEWSQDKLNDNALLRFSNKVLTGLMHEFLCSYNSGEYQQKRYDYVILVFFLWRYSPILGPWPTSMKLSASLRFSRF
jgi:hypothetical protein